MVQPVRSVPDRGWPCLFRGAASVATYERAFVRNQHAVATFFSHRRHAFARFWDALRSDRVRWRWQRIRAAARIWQCRLLLKWEQALGISSPGHSDWRFDW